MTRYHGDGCGREDGDRCTCNDMADIAADLASGAGGSLEDLRSYVRSVPWAGPYAVRVNMALGYRAAAIASVEAAADTLAGMDGEDGR